MEENNVVTNVYYWQELWNIWDVRVIVLSSLFLQTFLLFVGPLRKRTAKGFINVLLWMSYLLTHVISSYGFGLITARIVTSFPTYTQPSSPAYTHPYLLALWSPFLLLHLSRPDTITAFSLEDNELWLRKSIDLSVYSYYVSQTVTTSIYAKSNLWGPACIIAFIGLIRYSKWIDSLRFASTVGTGIYLPKRFWLTNIEESDEMSNLQVLKHAYKLATLFKGLIVDFSFNFSKCSESRYFFIKLTPRDAFRVVEREQNFFYEFIYTRAWILQTWSTYCLRVAEFVALWVALVLFCIEDKSAFRKADTLITYLLIGGSIILDLSTMIMVLTSDWCIAYFRSCNGSLKQIGTCLVFLTSWWPKIVYRRWSNSLSQYNLLKYCLRPKKERSDDSDPIVTMLLKTIEGLRYVETLKFDDGMRDFIVVQLKTKSSIADNPSTAREIQSARGEWVLRNEGCMYLLPWIEGLDFDQSLLTWHVATDLCFHTDNGDNNNDEAKRVRSLSKWLSDYMFYLLMQTALMSSVDAQGEKRFRDTCDEVKKFFREKNIRATKANKLKILTVACETIISSYTEVKSDSTSVLMGARELAEKLVELGSIRKWEVLSKVWVEMLCYVASHCKASVHMKQIQQGGQLITFVWLLMIQFALVN